MNETSPNPNHPKNGPRITVDLVRSPEDIRAIAQYLKEAEPSDEDWLFPSRKTGKPLTIQAVNALVKKWTRTINEHEVA